MTHLISGRQGDNYTREYRNYIRRNIVNHLVITDHRLEFNQDFNWTEAEILDDEPYLN